MPFQKFIDPRTGQLSPAEQIRDYFEATLDSSKDTITSCGTGISWMTLILGVTASIVFLALEVSGFRSQKSLYDGSWTEWASRHADNKDMIVKNK
jgi:3-mercaptopyruvate sulfurtransferase SseA